MYDFDAWILKLFPCGSAVGQRKNEAGAFAPDDASAFAEMKPLASLANDAMFAPLCPAGHIISEAASLPKAASFAHRANIIAKAVDFRQRLLHGGGGWIRTTVGIASRFTVCPLWPLGNTPVSSPQAPDRLASGQGRKLAPSAAAPFPIEPASLGFDWIRK